MERLLGAPWMSGGNMLPLQVNLFDKKKLGKGQEMAGLKPSQSLQPLFTSRSISKREIYKALVSQSCLCGAIFANMHVFTPS